MAVFHKHRFPALWTPQRVPVEPVEIDWSHPLAQGLVSCYLPGGPAGLIDLAKSGPNLPVSGAASIKSGTRGPGIGQYGVGDVTATASPAQQIPNTAPGASVFWFGEQVGQPGGGNILLLGVQPDNAGSSPYFSYCVWQSPGSGSNTIYAGSSSVPSGNAAGTLSSATTPVVFSAAATFAVGGNQSVYINGTAAGGVDAIGATPFTYTSTAQVCISCTPGNFRYGNTTTYLGLIYNRALSASEIRELNANPFSMLRPKARRVYRASLSTGYAASLTEAGSATDQQTTGVAVAFTELAGAADHPATGVLAVSFTESASATDLRTASVPASLTELASATDSQSPVALNARAQTEATSAADTVTSGFGVSANVAETATATDTSTRATGTANNPFSSDFSTDFGAQSGPSLSEGASAADVTSFVQSAYQTVAESAGAIDAVAFSTSKVAAQTDTTIGADAPSVGMTAASAVSDTASVTDYASTSPSIAQLSESLTAIDTPTVGGNYAVISETAPTSDSQSAMLAGTVAVVETAPASNTVFGSEADAILLADSANSLDAPTVGLAVAGSTSDTALASDQPSPALVSLPVTEAGSAADSGAGSLAASPGIGEVGSAADALSVGNGSISLVEAGTAADSPTPAGGGAASISDTVAAVSSQSGALPAAVTFSETAAAADLSTPTLGALPFAETAAGADISSVARAVTATAAEVVIPNDGFTTGTSSVAFAEAATALDTPAATQSGTAAFSDTQAAAEIIASIIPVGAILVTDAIAVADVPTESASAAVAIVETAVLDPFSADFTADYGAGYSVADNLSISLPVVAVTDTAAPLDTTSLAAVAPAQLTEVAGATDIWSQASIGANAAVETAAATDVVSAAQAPTSAISEVNAGTESVASALRIGFVQSDAPAVGENLAASLAPPVSIDDHAAAGDVFTFAVPGTAGVSDAVSVADALNLAFNAAVSVAEAGAASDARSATLDTATELLEALTTNDAYAGGIAYFGEIVEAGSAIDRPAYASAYRLSLADTLLVGDFSTISVASRPSAPIIATTAVPYRAAGFQGMIDRALGVVGSRLGRPHNAYRIIQTSSGDFPVGWAKLASNAPIHRNRVTSRDLETNLLSERTLWYELAADMSPFTLGDVFLSSEPAYQSGVAYGTGATSMPGTAAIDGFALAWHAVMSPPIGARISHLAGVYRPDLNPMQMRDRSQRWAVTHEADIPLILESGVYRWGQPGQPASLVPVGLGSNDREYRQGAFAPDTIGTTPESRFYAYLPDLPGYDPAEGDALITLDDTRFVMTAPYLQQSGVVGYQMTIERTISGV